MKKTLIRIHRRNKRLYATKKICAKLIMILSFVAIALILREILKFFEII